VSKPNDTDLLYYQREISFLRHMGKRFAHKYPKIARRLSFMESEVSDPHLDRLVESFAFLTSYLQKDIDNQLPRFSSALLDILYPHLNTPIPPMSIIQFKPTTSKPMTESYKVPKNFTLYAEPRSGEMCHFRTGYETEIWPIEIENVELIKSESVDFYLSPHSYMMKISLKAFKTPLHKLDIKSLRFYINGTSTEQNTLYQLLFEEDYKVGLEFEKGKTPKILPKGSIKPVGFTRDESLVPCPANAHPAYGLLQEYFAFPRKFMFFDVENLDFSKATNEAALYIPMMDTDSAKSITFSISRLSLGCTPITNLFKRTSEPLRFDHKKIEYRMVPDYRREVTTEIHSIQKLFMSSLNASEAREIQPYFSYTHKATTEEQTTFWAGRRTITANPDIPGTDIWLSFVNWDLKPEMPDADVVYASLLCTNRQLAGLMTPNTVMKSNDPVPMASMTCLHQPTDTVYPSSEGQTQWQLISSLSVNYTSCSSDPESLKSLKEIFRLFNASHEKSKNIEINSLQKMETKQITRRLGTDAWRSFTKGTGITLTVDEKDPHGSLGIFLFASVLSRFFGLYTQVNSFTELTLKSTHKEGVWKTWPPHAGDQKLI
jgi:type VI secretion system protein ImpG